MTVKPHHEYVLFLPGEVDVNATENMKMWFAARNVRVYPVTVPGVTTVTIIEVAG